MVAQGNGIEGHPRIMEVNGHGKVMEWGSEGNTGLEVRHQRPGPLVLFLSHIAWRTPFRTSVFSSMQCACSGR